MYKHYIPILISILIHTTSFSQISIKDINTNTPISNAKLFSKEGQILGSSNLKGDIKIKKSPRIKNDTVEIYHSNYLSKKIALNKLIENPNVFLKLDSVTKLEEVIISVKKPEYLILKGNFISYQIIDDVPLTFSDGIIEYYINLKKSKLASFKIIESRIFRNNDSIKAFGTRKGNSTLNILSTIPPFSFHEEALIAHSNKLNINNKEVITKEGDIIGSLKTQDSKTILSIQYYSPEKTKKIVLPGIKSIINNKIINERFDSSIPQLEKINSINKYYSSDITRNKIAIKYELIQDFYTLEKKIVSKEKFKNQLKKDKITQKAIDHKKHFKTPDFIKSQLFKQLKLIKKNNYSH